MFHSVRVCISEQKKKHCPIPHPRHQIAQRLVIPVHGSHYMVSGRIQKRNSRPHKSVSLLCFYYQSIKISEQPCSNGVPKRYTVLWEGIRTTHKLILRVPHGSRPHGHDRSLTMCVNDPECWKSTPVLQSIAHQMLNTTCNK